MWLILPPDCGFVPPLRAGTIDWDLRRIKVQMDSSEQRKQVTGTTNVLIFSWHFKYLWVSAELSNVLDNTSRPSISAGLRQGHNLLWKLTKTKIRLCRRCGTTPLPLLRLSGWVCVSVQRKSKDWQMRHCGHPHFLSRPVPCSPLLPKPASFLRDTRKLSRELFHGFGSRPFQGSLNEKVKYYIQISVLKIYIYIYFFTSNSSTGEKQHAWVSP